VSFDAQADLSGVGAALLVPVLTGGLSGASDATGTGYLVFDLTGSLAGDSNWAGSGASTIAAAAVTATGDSNILGVGGLDIVGAGASLDAQSDFTGLGEVVNSEAPVSGPSVGGRAEGVTHGRTLRPTIGGRAGAGVTRGRTARGGKPCVDRPRVGRTS
jgi:hypothetical protein